MPRERFNPIEYYFVKISARNRLLERNPQCKDCEQMQFWTFSPDYYNNTVLNKYCKTCPKYKEAE